MKNTDKFGKVVSLEEVKKNDGLDYETEVELSMKIRQGGEEGIVARNDLVEANKGLVYMVANKYESCGLEYDDLCSEGVIGLIGAAQKYDPTRGAKFSTFAVNGINQSMLNAISKENRRVSRYTTDGNMVYLDATYGDDSNQTLGEVIPDPKAVNLEDMMVENDMSIVIKRALGKLTNRERQIIVWMYGCEGGETKSAGQIAELLGITPARVRQIYNTVLRKLYNNPSIRELWNLISRNNR